MREIKFRVWDTANERIVDEPYRFEIMSDYEKKEYNYVGDFLFYEGWGDVEDGIRRPCFLMQFTGLKDRKGNEVYHKDYLKTGKKIFVVEWQKEEARFVLLPTIGNPDSWKFMDECDRMEVVGNVYQHPELTKN